MRIAFFSTMGGLPWGGSEELWSRAAAELLRQGHEVHFNSRDWKDKAEQLKELIAAGAKPSFRSRMRLGRSLRRGLESLRIIRLKYLGWLQKMKPDFVLISFSCHTDDPHIANACHMLGIPYAIVLQAANPNHWIMPRDMPSFRSAYQNARRCYFVSPENRDLLETNLAVDMSQSEIVDNPFIVPLDAAPAWPSADSAWKLACVARIHFVTKSQDLVLRALREPKWRNRNLQITFWGNDNGDLSKVQELIELYGLGKQVSYGGFADDMVGLWSQYHGLFLPSRSEGNALALIEAMVCGRVPITTKVGRAAELIDDNVSGFLAPAATVELIDEVLERAWQRRHAWQAMGQQAASAIRARHSLCPGVDFANRILSLASQPKAARRIAA